MRKLLVVTLAAALAAGPALAQSGMGQPGMGQSGMSQPGMSQQQMDHSGMQHANPRHRAATDRPMSRSAGRSMDRGARGGDVNAAYMGGGMILEGAPGAPAPMPQATPPGEMPRNMVPMR